MQNHDYTPATLAELTARKYPERGTVRLLDPLTARQRAASGSTSGTATSGHADGQPGLRGHSIDAATYPWRVVAGYWRCRRTGLLLARWTVVGADGITAAACVEQVTPAGNRIVTDDEACREAHELARLAKAKYPDGRRPAHLPTLAHANGTSIFDL